MSVIRDGEHLQVTYPIKYWIGLERIQTNVLRPAFYVRGTWNVGRGTLVDLT